ncbi:MAG: SET domain-containing protein-lysine N-methyltransferase [Candidatus Moraniibacteriota bacterium]
MPIKHRHPAHVQVKRTHIGLGLFAVTALKKGTTVLEYIGERIPTSVGDERDNRYIFNVSTRIDIDGSPRWNTARYANHSCRPNCEAINRRGRIFFVAKKSIASGEEITLHYGKDHFEGYIKPVGCRCMKCSPLGVASSRATRG